MSHLEVFIADVDGIQHVALLSKGKLQDLYCDPPIQAVRWAAVYQGKIVKIDSDLQAAIIDIGEGHTGFLPLPRQHSNCAGDHLLVQVSAEAQTQLTHENDKLPKLSTRLTFNGSFHDVTLVPKENQGFDVSWTSHTLHRQVSPQEIERDRNFLESRSQKIINEHSIKKDSCLILPAPSAIERALLWGWRHEITHIYASDRTCFNTIVSWAEIYDPTLPTSRRLKLFKPETNASHLFETYDLFSQIEDLSKTRLDLPSGGSLIIEKTTAATIIDINQGSTSHKALANEEAAHLSMQQVKCRNLSGILLIDFINVHSRHDRHRLLETLTQLCSKDAGGAVFHGFTRLGLAEITRPRRTKSYQELLYQVPFNRKDS